MTSAPEVILSPTRCAICGTTDNSDELYAATIGADVFTPERFSARRRPDRRHHRIVRCRSCGLVRSDPAAPPNILARLYTDAELTYGEEVANIRATYGRYLDRAVPESDRRGVLLEIGCGNGFALVEALERGWADVRGVEPTVSAVERADPQIRPRIVCDVMKPGLFEHESFDTVCIFQTLDHLPDPGEILDECFRLLRPRGRLLCLNHDVASLSARFLGERSPIVDIEHTYLYSVGTLTQLLAKHGYGVVESGSVRNTYSFRYLLQMAPLSGGVFDRLLDRMGRSRIARIRLTVPLGNLYVVAEKPPGP